MLEETVSDLEGKYLGLTSLLANGVKRGDSQYKIMVFRVCVALYPFWQKYNCPKRDSCVTSQCPDKDHLTACLHFTGQL